VRRRRRLVVWGGVGVLVAALAVGLVLGTAGSSAQAPLLAPLPRLGGGAPVALTGAHGPHRPTAITFFASWCTPCRRELPEIAGVARAEAAQGGRVVFLGVDGNDDPASGLAFARASGVTFPVAVDATSSVAPRFGLYGYPDTVFVDAGGDVAGVVRGPISAATLRQWLGRLSSGSA